MNHSAKTFNERHFQLDEFYSDLKEGTRNISFIDPSQIRLRPFPGLRPFRTSEFRLFNGRDGQAEELIKRLKKNHFLAVIGSSGTGKSSLIRAGLIPQLLGGYLHEAGLNWDIAICRPGRDPIENLAAALARVKSRSNFGEKLMEEFNVVEPLLNSSAYGILKVDELINLPGKPREEQSNLLIIIDQFEELFRFDRDDLHKPDLENRFVNLLLKASSNPDVAIYVIVTMRSEFLGDCVKYRGLPEAINEGQYLVPQLSREQIREVIEDPILIAGKKIDAGLVELLVNEIEASKAKRDLDQLPILQHALMRTYQQAMKKGATNDKIVYQDYLAAGKMEYALAMHAEEEFRKLSDPNTEINVDEFIKDQESFSQTETALSHDQKIAKLVFQALTDASTDKKAGRRPTELEMIYKICQEYTPDQVNKVINHFRDEETSFIMPPPNIKLADELIMDISHESLMRQWKRLRHWVNDEAELSKTYLRLVDSASQYSLFDAAGKVKKREKELLYGSELQVALDWYEKFRPTGTSPDQRYKEDFTKSPQYLNASYWAERYKRDFTRGLEYLEASRKAEQKRIMRRKMQRYSIFGAIIIGLLFTIIYILNKSEKHQFDYEADQIADAIKSAISKNELAIAMADKDPANALQLEKDALYGLNLANKQLDTLRNKKYLFINFFSSTSDEISGLYSKSNKIDSLVKKQSIYLLEKDFALSDTVMPENKADTIFDIHFVNAIFPDSVNGSQFRVWHAEKKLIDSIKNHGPLTQVVFPTAIDWAMALYKDSTTHYWPSKPYYHEPKIVKDDRITSIAAISYVKFGFKMLSALNSKRIVEWNLNGTERISSNRKVIYNKNVQFDDNVVSVAISPRREIIFTATDKGIGNIWRADTSHVKLDTAKSIAFNLYQDSVILCSAFSKDGSMIATGSKDNTVKIWNTKDGKLIKILNGHSGPITSVAFSLNNDFVFTGSLDRTFRRWRLPKDPTDPKVNWNNNDYNLYFDHSFLERIGWKNRIQKPKEK